MQLSNIINEARTAIRDYLGGDAFDERLLNYMADDFQKTNGIDLRKDKMALQRLKEAAEKAKCDLSSMTSTNVNLPFITADASGPKHLQVKVSRTQFENMVADLINRTITPCQKCIKDAGITKKDAERVLNAAFDAITASLVKGERVQLSGFGVFETKAREARIARNPQTKEPMEIPATRVPTFKASKALKDTVAK